MRSTSDSGVPNDGREAESVKVRRSWLLPKDVADAFARAADDVHYDSRGRIGKSEAQAAIILAGLRHLDEVHATLSKTERHQQSQ